MPFDHDALPEEAWQTSPHQLSFTISPFQVELLTLNKNLDEPVKWPAINSVKHLNRAWKLLDDPHMATFRAITAEEEAATAIFWSLRRHRYPNSDRLQPRNHVHKQSLTPYLQAITTYLAKQTTPLLDNFKLSINQQLIPGHLELQFPFKFLRDHVAVPEPPLNFSIIDDARFPDFQEQLQALATRNGSTTIRSTLKQRANLRNRLLYANKAGIEQLQTSIAPVLITQTQHTLRLLTVLLLIDPHPREQLLITQLLPPFLNMLDAFPKKPLFE